jgi:hypothetical protein
MNVIGLPLASKLRGMLPLNPSHYIVPDQAPIPSYYLLPSHPYESNHDSHYHIHLFIP